MTRLTRSIAVALLVGLLGTTALAGEVVPTEVLRRGRARPMHTYANITEYVRDKAEYRRQWERFGFKGERPPVNFSNRRVVFVATHESGSCPKYFENVVLRREERELIVRLRVDAPADGACTDDWRPRSFVLLLQKKGLPRGELDVKVRSFVR